MLFNSIDFAVFLPLVFGVYWWLGRRPLRWQNQFLLGASYLFYGWWDWRFLFLVLFSTGVDYTVGLKLAKEISPERRKWWLRASIAVNLGLLGFFKYYNFFVNSFTEAFSFLGHPLSVSTLSVVLPVGISFYTFQTLSYTVDVYRKKLTPTDDFVVFATFVSFFPQLVAGPIERATDLLPQFYQKRTFVYREAVDGLRQMLWGLFKKVVIADSCAEFANLIFNQSEQYGGSTLLWGALFFTFQIYGDFSGYSDIAIGTAKLFGFTLRQNFAFPYFARDVAEFWRRWHISLSSWFRDYLYIPLGGSRGGRWQQVRNTFIIFVVSGFWHGANWTFVVWGALNALYFLPLLLTGRNRRYHYDEVAGHRLPSGRELLEMASTFSLTVLAWVFFRAESVTHALRYLSEIFSSSLFTFPELTETRRAVFVSVLVIGFVVVEWLGRTGQYALDDLPVRWPKPVRWACYYCIALAILLFHGQKQSFIYFQF